ncbi:glu S.griseus protease inhibitor isoform X2 [Setaria viridis]|uniref:glu S.griseus protease inhibitor isoform X2 n=1 Tax=Setaria viridis TaxID=4556 RepID=UPI001493C192|nr:subtilisin-chymotrypsin inhibitor CI-1C-like isoform X2 [Setaria viridis]
MPDPLQVPIYPQLAYKYQAPRTNQRTGGTTSHKVQVQELDRSAKMSGDSGKSSWPEVVGLSGDAAKQKILADRPDVQVFLVPVGSMVTTDFDTKRVRVFVNTAGYVAEVPNIG